MTRMIVLISAETKGFSGPSAPRARLKKSYGCPWHLRIREDRAITPERRPDKRFDASVHARTEVSQGG